MKYSFFLFLFIQNYSGIWAQPAKGRGSLTSTADKDYVVRQYTSENGLPQNTARDLLFDDNGFLWIATENGLARFDGQRFRVYNNANTRAIKTSLFSIIFQTPEHTILATSAYPNSPILRITPDHRILNDSTDSRIHYKFVNVRSGCIFDATSLFVRRGGRQNPDRRATSQGLLDRLSKTDTFEIIDRHEMVASLGGDWYFLDNTSGRIVKLPPGLDRTDNRIFCLDESFCSVGPDNRLRVFRNGMEAEVAIDRSVTDLIDKRKPASGSPGFHFYRKGNLVLVQANNDIYRLYFEAHVLKASLLFKDLDFLADQSIRCFQYDSAAQRLFIGTESSGVFIVTKKNFHISAFQTRDMNDNIVLAFELLPHDKILTSHGVLNEGHPGGSLLFKAASEPDWNCLYKASDHTIWFSRGRHLFQYDSSFSRQLFSDTLGLDSYVTSIQEDKAHTLWISSVSSLLKIEKGHLQYLQRHIPFFIDHRIQSTAQVIPGKWWIATSDGLYAYDMAAGKMDDQPLLPGVYVRSIYKAKDSSIWLGTYGDGYFKYASGKFAALPLDVHQYLATAHTFLEDSKGFLWISTDHGLFRIKKRDLDEQEGTGNKGIFFYYFDKSSGLNTDEFNGGCNPSSLVDRDGNFYIPSMDGLVHFNPDSIRCEWPDRPILIDHIEVDSSNLENTQSLSIYPDFNQLTVGITTPYYGSETNLQLEYKLNSVGDQWYPVGKEGRIYINRLPYGKYTLLIRKRNGWGPAEFAVSTLAFEVRRRWYNTRWFDLLVAGLILLGLIMIYVFRPRLLLLQNRRLQVKVEKRTAELEQSTIIKERLISAIMHDLRSPLFAQGYMIGHLERNFKKIPETELKDLLSELNESNQRICQFSTDFLAWYKTRLDGFQLELYPVELAPFVKEVADFYLELAGRKGLTFTIDIPHGIFLRTDRNILAIVLRNLVDNAVKYTQSGDIHITSEIRAGNVSIVVKDTGAGMSAAKISELLKYPRGNSHKTSTTYGYRLIIELAQLIQAGLHIESETGKGTTVALSFKG